MSCTRRLFQSKEKKNLKNEGEKIPLAYFGSLESGRWTTFSIYRLWRVIYFDINHSNEKKIKKIQENDRFKRAYQF